MEIFIFLICSPDRLGHIIGNLCTHIGLGDMYTPTGHPFCRQIPGGDTYFYDTPTGIPFSDSNDAHI